jgi:hypothetical protein
MKVEVKIQCDCGTRYKFDVEPLHGRMPQKVDCPGCGVDGTPAANECLRQRLGTVAVRQARFLPGIAGAAAAGFVGMLAWYFLIKVTGHQIAFAAWGVGLLAGLGARGLGREGSRGLGMAAGTAALVAILGGQLLAAQGGAGELKQFFSDGSISWLTLLWLLLAVASAFRLGSSRALGNASS